MGAQWNNKNPVSKTKIVNVLLNTIYVTNVILDGQVFAAGQIIDMYTYVCVFSRKGKRIDIKTK